MRNPAIRDAMGKVYRIIEKYEEPPTIGYTDEAQAYFSGVNADCQDVWQSAGGNEFIRQIALALVVAIETRFKQKNGTLAEKGG